VTAVADRANLPEDVLAERLLLSIYAYGTDTGTKSVAGGTDRHSEDDIRYTRRRYLNADTRRGGPRSRSPTPPPPPANASSTGPPPEIRIMARAETGDDQAHQVGVDRAAVRPDDEVRHRHLNSRLALGGRTQAVQASARLVPVVHGDGALRGEREEAGQTVVAVSRMDSAVAGQNRPSMIFWKASFPCPATICRSTRALIGPMMSVPIPTSRLARAIASSAALLNSSV
jgi:hypothetical protein